MESDLVRRLRSAARWCESEAQGEIAHSMSEAAQHLRIAALTVERREERSNADAIDRAIGDAFGESLRRG